MRSRQPAGLNVLNCGDGRYARRASRRGVNLFERRDLRFHFSRLWAESGGTLAGATCRDGAQSEPLLKFPRSR